MYFDIHYDLENWDTPEFCTNNSLIITGNREINAKGVEPDYDELIRRYSVIEDNVSYTSDENPFFVNPTIGDYRLRDDVTDFPMIEFEKITLHFTIIIHFGNVLFFAIFPQKREVYRFIFQ